LHCLRHYEYTEEFTGIDVHSIENLMPSCGSCNRYKATMDLETFRRMLSGIPKRLARDVCTYNIAVRFGLIEEHHEPIRFYFERMDKEMENCGNREFHKMMDNGEWGCNNMESDNYGCETDFGDYCIDHEERKSNER
jgi:hypothetical protein